MKKIFLIILITSFISCASDPKPIEEGQTIKIWTIENYIISGKELLETTFNKGILTFNVDSKESYINFFLNDETTNSLELKWQKVDKNLKLDSVNILNELTYIISNSKIELEDVEKDFIIKGQNSERVIKVINNEIQRERSNESRGLIPLIYNIWNPTPLEETPYSILKKGDSFNINFDGDNILLNSETTSIKLKFIGEQQWLGY